MKSLRILTGHNRTGLFSVATVLIENMINSKSEHDYRVELGSEYLYFDSTHGENVWEYYFNQVRGTKNRHEYDSVEHGFLFDRSGLLDVGNREKSYKDTIDKASIIFREFIGFNPYMTSHLHAVQEELNLTSEYIAVHKRETDYLLHASHINRSDYFFRKIEERLGNEKIFLATDSQRALWEFRLRYGSRLVNLSIPRSRDNTGLHLMKMSRIPNWVNGENAVLDSYLLSAGKKLFRTRSNLTTFSLILNPGIECIEMDHDVVIR